MRHFLLIIVLFLSTSSLNAQVGVPEGDTLVRPVFERADLVCVCRFEGVNNALASEDRAERRDRNLMIVNAKILNVFKSPSQVQGGSISFQYPGNPMSPGFEFRTNQIALLFLNRQPGGIYDLADPMIGLTIFSGAPTGPRPTGFEGLQSVLMSYIRTERKQDQINAMLLLKGMPGLDASSLSEMDALSSSTDSELAFRSLAILLETNSSGSVSKLRRYLDGDKDTQPSLGLDSAAGALSQVTDIGALPDIEALTGSRFLSIQFAAMNAIRRIASPTSVPTLVQRLDDPNGNVQYSAVITLAELYKAEGDYGPDLPTFEKDPRKYVALWKQRWAEQRNAPPQ